MNVSGVSPLALLMGQGCWSSPVVLAQVNGEVVGYHVLAG